jgi:hypothetical protein
MHVARSIVVLFLIMAMVFVYNPQVREEISQTWDAVQPGVLQFMDGLYAAIRNFVAGTDLHEGIEDNAPGVEFDLIITLARGKSS